MLTVMKHNIVIGLFVFVLFGVGFLNMIMPSRAKISELENRALETFPDFSESSLFSGKYFASLEAYYSDHFYNRENFVMVSQAINEYKGIHGADKVELVMMDTEQFVNNGGEDKTSQDRTGQETTLSGATESQPFDQAQSADESGEKLVLTQGIKNRIASTEDLNQRVRLLGKEELDLFSEIEPAKVAVPNHDTVLEQMAITDDEDLSGYKKNGILVVNDECYELFGYSEGSLNLYADAINSFAAMLPEGDQVYSLVVPGKIEFIKSEKYRNMAESHADAINYLNQQFSDAIRPVNVYTPLQEHSDEYIYFRSDHHWTALGAYYAYRAFAKAIGDRPYDLEDFEHVSVEGFLGTLYGHTLNKTVKEHPDTVDIYLPFVENDFKITTEGGAVLDWDVINMNYAKISNKYMVFISGDNPLSVIKTKAGTGRKILVFKDSYGNAFVPWLMNHYDEIHIIDPRHYDGGAVSYAKAHDIHEFMFLNYNVVIAGNTGFTKNIYKVTY